MKSTCPKLLATTLVFTAHLLGIPPSLAQSQPISIFVVRHSETDNSQTTIPLSVTGRQRAEVLTKTVSGVKFTHLFATHTIRTRQMLEAIAQAQNVPITQLPVPGSILDGHAVTDQTSRRAAIEPIAAALLKLPPGSTALAVLNSENIFAILNRLGVPAAGADQFCKSGSMCVPCLDNKCFPAEYDHLWHLVLESGKAVPLTLVELRYGLGWKPDR